MGSKLGKIIATFLAFSIAIAFYCFTRSLAPQNGSITGSAGTVLSPSSAESTTSPNASAGESDIQEEETFLLGDMFYNPSAALHSIKRNESRFTAYGAIQPDDGRLTELQNILDNYKKHISLAVWKTDGSKAISYNLGQSYFSACTIKIAYVLHCCRLIDQGLAEPDTVMTYEAKHYHKGSGTIRKSPYGSRYSIETLINLCLSISDNVAYKMLMDYFGLESYNNMVAELGCDSLHIDRMWGSAVNVKDFITIWNEVYEYLISDAKMADTLKKSCTNTPFNYGTLNLKDVDYSHKSGDNFGDFAAYNDAGIVWTDDAYIYAIFTNSEGTSKDITTVNDAMDLVYKIFGVSTFS